MMAETIDEHMPQEVERPWAIAAGDVAEWLGVDPNAGLTGGEARNPGAGIPGFRPGFPDLPSGQEIRQPRQKSAQESRRSGWQLPEFPLPWPPSTRPADPH